MKKFNLHYILVAINILIAVLLISDTFLIKATVKTEVFNTYSSVLTRNGDGPSHWTNIILANSGNEYREPANVGYTLKYQDTFSVQCTGLFKRPVKLFY